MRKLVGLLVFLLGIFCFTYGQDIDTTNTKTNDVSTALLDTVPAHSVDMDKQRKEKTKIKKDHDPVKAACWSIIPGGGQIYNKKYWKLPIVYAGIGVTGYLIYNFGSEANMYRKEIKARFYADVNKLNPALERYSTENLVGMRDYYLRNMEISIAACAVIYLLNIVDAAVDAHLYGFNISDDLSMQFKPTILPPMPNYSSNIPAVSLVLKF